MVYCPTCSEQQDDVTRFCRFCGNQLPGGEMMSKLRQEALALASLRAGRDLSGVQGDNSRTLAALKQNADNGTTFKPVNNGDHLRSTRQATDSLKRLMG